ncbi:MAG: beta-galactosidase [Planctomycetia bacterium]|nr:beta-galactosidase [Planctomycetia bacterium]
MKFRLFALSVLFFGTLLVPDAALCQIIDDSPTRVQTTLDPGFKLIGTLRPKNVHQINTSRWTIGCEVLDREYASYDSYKEYLAPLGIKRIRLQGGWARTEKEKGLYDFAWLDYIINDAISRGLEIWLETSYGNPIYPGGGGRSLAGGIPASEEGLTAWDNWVRAMAQRYKDKVRDWSMWNEPVMSDPEAVFAFNIRTAEIIKSVIPNARIGALVLMQADYAHVGPFLERLKKENKFHLFHWIVYHHYTPNPDEPYPEVEKMKAVIRSYSNDLKLWQGESGVMSEWGPVGALNKMHWTELTQAKWDARRMLGDLGHDADSGIFTIADYQYRTTPWINGLARYGLIKADTADRGFKILKVKTAWYTVQNIVSVFNDDLQRDTAFNCQVACEKSLAVFGFHFTESQSPLFVFWNKSDIPQNDNATLPATFTVKNESFKDPVWVDTITGNVYKIPDNAVSSDGNDTTFINVPVYDAPAFITGRDNLDLDFSEFVKANP